MWLKNIFIQQKNIPMQFLFMIEFLWIDLAQTTEIRPTSGVIDGRARGASLPPGKLNVKTGPPLLDILIFSIP